MQAGGPRSRDRFAPWPGKGGRTPFVSRSNIIVLHMCVDFRDGQLTWA